MASVSGATSSLGNTSLRGYGGLVSGLDRDALIEQMTMGTTTKITNQKNAMTNLSWKQEAYQGISDSVLALQDNYFSYASGTNMKDSSIFSKNQITVHGDDSVTKFVKASGTSNMLDYLAIQGVSQLASSSALKSKTMEAANSITTGIRSDKLTDEDACKTSKLEGLRLTFGTPGDDTLTNKVSFTFASEYTVKNGDTTETKTIDYTADVEDLVKQLNEALKNSDVTLGDDKISDVMKFEVVTDATTGDKKLGIVKGSKNTNYKISADSSALTYALGYKVPDGDDFDGKMGLSFDQFNKYTGDYEKSAVVPQTMAQYMTGEKLSFTYAGQTKEIELVKAGEDPKNIQELADNLNKRLLSAFGGEYDTDGTFLGNNVSAKVVTKDVTDDDGNVKRVDFLEFEVADNNMTLKVNSSYSDVRETLGITKGASNKLSVDSSLATNWKMLGFESEQDCRDKLADGLVINGVKIDVTADSSVNTLIDKINKNKNVGVKATYLSASNQFSLIANETGKGRQIDVGAEGTAANTIFGGTFTSGQNAKITVNYGNGVTTEIESSSNTFNLEGLSVTVTNKFDATNDPSKVVTFSAKADVDGATEKVKKFIEEYNALAKKVNTEITTKPDSSYGPLTEDQKSEMSETSIENWENKAKEGLLYNDGTLRSLSIDLQGIMAKLMGNGVSYNDLEKIGITPSTDWYSGGTIDFDEAKFKAAMESDPELVGNIISGGGDVKKGLAQVMEDTLTVYATRYSYKNGGSNGRLIEEAGSKQLPSTLKNNQIYKQLQEMQTQLEKLQALLTTEQDRYISQFTTMETLISQMNTQASYLANLSS